MAVQEERVALRIGTIQLGEEGITEFTREGHRSVFVRRSEIERVALARGFTSERPIAALVGAVVCLGFTAAALAMMIASALGPRGVVSLKLLIAVAFPALIGALCLWTLMHRGLHLRVSTTRDTRKLRLFGAIDRAALRDALTAARARFGYDVDLTHLDEVASHRRRA
jgi:hypothetical protein